MSGVTPAMREVLAWLAERGRLDEDLRGGDLIRYYEGRERARRIAEYRARGEEPPAWVTDGHPTTPRSHAWRRTGGRLLSNMQAAGLARWVGSSHGTPLYRLTDEAKKLARPSRCDAGGGLRP